MRSESLRPAFLVLLLLLSDKCASTTTEGSRVRVTSNQQATTGCTFLRNVDVPNVMGGDDTEHRLQNAGAEAGADLVFVASQDYRGGQVRGEAYRCQK